jgi:hypothetical protein
MCTVKGLVILVLLEMHIEESVPDSELFSMQRHAGPVHVQPRCFLVHQHVDITVYLADL